MYEDKYEEDAMICWSNFPTVLYNAPKSSFVKFCHIQSSCGERTKSVDFESEPAQRAALLNDTIAQDQAYCG